MYSRYEIKRGNRRLLRLARILCSLKDGDLACYPLTIYARRTPSRFTTTRNGFFGRRKWSRVKGVLPNDVRMKSTMDEFSLTRHEVDWLFSQNLNRIPTADDIKRFVAKRAA